MAGGIPVPGARARLGQTVGRSQALPPTGAPSRAPTPPTPIPSQGVESPDAVLSQGMAVGASQPMFSAGPGPDDIRARTESLMQQRAAAVPAAVPAVPAAAPVAPPAAAPAQRPLSLEEEGELMLRRQAMERAALMGGR